MSKLTEEEEGIFPLSDIGSVVKLFKIHLEKNEEPNLAICSIIIGYIENTLTCSRVLDSSDETDNEENSNKHNKNSLGTKLPQIEYENVTALYQRFLSIVKAHVDVSAFGNPKYATRELVKRVSDVVWCTLSSTYYKDRAHLQSIYSYMTGAKLDSTGTTIAVVAALQALDYSDVHLALSEDHTWVVCGEFGEISVEVTWHGKGNEDKRGIPVTEDVYSKSWLYVNGKPIICTRHMELAAIVSNINPGINATTDSDEVLLLQQALLWLLYDFGHLTKYPMAIDNLADLEEMSPTRSRPPAMKIYEEAIVSNVRHYDNQHVYPYAYLAGYCYRHQHYKVALKAWASAAKVIKNYNYSRDDEEIYKEFLDVATELIPHLFRSSSSISCGNRSNVQTDPCAFASLLEFYDGICCWEEDSPTPVLHIGWAKALVTAIGKFDSKVRSKISIVCVDDSTEIEEDDLLEEGSRSLLSYLATDDVIKPTSIHDQNGNTSDPFLDTSERSTGTTISDNVEGTLLRLYSAKMCDLKDLLLADKLNSQAISLLLSAQSQVTMSKKRDRGNVSTNTEMESSQSSTLAGRAKRSRREN